MSERTMSKSGDVLAGLRVSLPDIAATAKVRRPVVSIWRSRYAHGNDPFPAPVAHAGQQPFFAASDVVDWMSRRSLGNNPDFGIEIAVRALRTTGGEIDPGSIPALCALLRLKATTGTRMSELDPEDAIDLADEVDPHDADSYREVESAEPHLPRLLPLADALADAAYTPAAALEAVLTHATPAPESALSPAALDLLARVSDALQQGPRLSVADPDPGRGDRLTAVLNAREHLEAPLAVIPEDSSRQVRRRLHTHRWGVQVMDLQDGFGAEALVISALTEAELSPAEVLERVEEIALRLEPGQRAVVLGPARALMEPAQDRQVEAVRSGLLRTDKLRAAVVLPAGLVPARSRERLALWVLGDAHPEVPIAHRWVMVADVADVLMPAGHLEPAVLEDLLTDLVAAMGTAAEVSAHAFAYARFTLTSRILAAGVGLLEQSRRLEGGVRVDDGATSARVQALLGQLARPEQTEVSFPVRSGPAVAARTARLGELADHRMLRRRSGNRVPEALIHRGTEEPGEVPVIGREELSGLAEVGSRVVHKLDLAQLPSSRLTEPGDVVFTATPHPAAMVDAAGFSLVEFPAQVLRVRSSSLVPAMLAQEINAQAPSARRWRQWQVRLVPEEQAPQLAEALGQIARAQLELRARARVLSRLSEELTAGVAAGVVHVGNDESGGRPPETE